MGGRGKGGVGVGSRVKCIVAYLLRELFNASTVSSHKGQVAEWKEGTDLRWRPLVAPTLSRSHGLIHSCELTNLA